jgi:hypothetical protein
MDERTRNLALIGAAVLVGVGLVYYLASHSGPPEPTIPPGQDLHHPLGTSQAGGPGSPAGGPAAGPAGNVQGPGGPGAMRPAGPPVPAAGTVDPRVGFGPSAGGPFRKR